MREIVKELDEVLHVFTYRRMISWKDCPHLLTPDNLAFRRALIAKYGANSSFIRSFLEGRFQRDTDQNLVFTDTDLDAMARAMRDDVETVRGPMRAAADFSGGGDKQVMRIASGLEEVYKDTQQTEDTNWLAGRWVAVLKEWEVPARNFYADAGGLGRAVIDNMEGKDYRGIHRYMNNQVARNDRDYSDRITEDHYEFKEFIQRNPVKLLKDTDLIRQARQRQFVMDDHNRIKLEPKKAHRSRCDESPDHLETAVMLWADYRAPKLGPKKEYHSKLEEKARQMRGTGAFPSIVQQNRLSLRSTR